ncbi:MAG: hypothetical protein M3018_12815 [Actinomycetota bacterium]|nr:hypothetical protein [Actinomycetota bacterium]
MDTVEDGRTLRVMPELEVWVRVAVAGASCVPTSLAVIVEVPGVAEDVIVDV